ncbi:MAG: hypothetical protein HRT71_14575 [Flavobacteriales bacterium]|nr:hypothetical protein [Flavobacteriales bacterium]
MMNLIKSITIALILATLLASCSKEDGKHECYDKKLEKNTNWCPADCPGFTACNGETYCNSCNAAVEGYGSPE